MIWHNIFERTYGDKGNVKTPRTTENPGTISRSPISPSREEEAYFHRNCEILHPAPSRVSDTALGAPEPTGEGGKRTAKAPGAAPARCQGPSAAERRQQRARQHRNQRSGPGLPQAPRGRAAALTHIILIVHRHVQPEQELSDVRVSRRAGPVQRGAVILREGSGERGKDGERLAGAAPGRPRLTWSARVAWARSRSSSARSSSRRPANARLHTATSDTAPSMLPTGRGHTRQPPINSAPGPAAANGACPPAPLAARPAGAAGICSPEGAGAARSRRAVGLQLPGRPAARPCCASVSGRGGW